MPTVVDFLSTSKVASSGASSNVPSGKVISLTKEQYDSNTFPASAPAQKDSNGKTIVDFFGTGSAAPTGPAAGSSGSGTTKFGADVSAHPFNPLNTGGQQNAEDITKGTSTKLSHNFLPALAEVSGFNSIKDSVTGEGQTMGTVSPTLGGQPVKSTAPSTFSTLLNTIPELPQAAANTLTSPLTRIAAQIKQTFGGKGTINLDKAGLAPVQSYSTQVQQDVNSGVPTWLAVFKQVPSVIFDTLFVTGEAARLLDKPSEVTLATGNKTAALRTDILGDTSKPVYIPISEENPAGAVVHDALSSSPKYNAENPTFLKISSTEQGFKGEMVQIKPGLLSTDVSKLFGENGRPTESIPGRAEVVVEKGGEVPKQELAQLHSGQASVVPGEPGAAPVGTAAAIREQLGVAPAAGAPTVAPELSAAGGAISAPVGSSASIKEALAPKVPVPPAGKAVVAAPATAVVPKQVENLTVRQQLQQASVERIQEALPSKNTSVTEQAEPRPASETLNVEVIPGLHKFIEEDVTPKAKGVAAGVKETFQGMVKVFNPSSLVPPKAMDILSTKIGDYEKQLFRTERTMKKVSEMWDKQPESAKLDFMAKMEAGSLSDVPKEFKPLAEMYKARFDNMYKLVNEYKDVNYLENWFPHIWKKEGEVGTWLNSKRPLAGNQSFLHERIFKTIQDGLDAGFKLVTSNPEELTQIAEAGVARFVMANKIRIEEKKSGFFQYVKFNRPVPAGFAKINDRIAEVYLPKDPDAIGSGAKIGNYYAQEDLARVINNYLSKDVLRETALGRGLMITKNLMNAFQLGVSAFHITAEAINAMLTSQDIGMSKLSRGDILGGAKELLTSPISAALYFNDGRKFYNGDPELMKIEHDIFSGGAKLRGQKDYQNSVLDNFTRNVREGNYPGALIRLPLAAIESTMRPIFGYMIPRLKVGAFRSLFSEEIKRNADKIASGDITKETLARDVWGNIENRFGLLNYDRLFWNQTFKTAMFLTTRAVGWNYGTAAELGGAVKDVLGGTGKTTGNVLNMRKGPDGSYQAKNEFEFTPKIRYSLALIFSTMMLGGMYMYAHTGKKPKSLLDWFYPPDQEGRRKQFPTYMKDIYSVAHDPKQMTFNKLAPELSTLIELMNNRNYYGDMVWNPNNGMPTKLKQMAQFVLSNSFTPFSISNQVQLSNKGGITNGERIESFLGITNAPAILNKTKEQLDLQKKEQDIYGAYAPRTPQQVNIDNLKAQAKKEIPNGDLTTFNQLKKMGAFKSPKDATYFLIDAKQSPEKRTSGIQKSIDKILKYQGKQ